MLVFRRLISSLQAASLSTQIDMREKLFSSITASVSILVVLLFVEHVDFGLPFKMLVLASMGASAFLLFVAPHSPMAQPWPVLSGHMLAAFIGVACVKVIPNVPVAAALAVMLSIFVMYVLHCLHPPSAATAMIAVLGGPEVHAIGWQFCYEVVALNAGLMVLLAILLNNLVPGRRYPMRHTHHAHHVQFAQQKHRKHPELNEEDFTWAVSQMDGLIDISTEDLIDIYEFALERAEQRKLKQEARSGNKDQNCK